MTVHSPVAVVVCQSAARRAISLLFVVVAYGKVKPLVRERCRRRRRQRQVKETSGPHIAGTSNSID